MLKIDNKLLKFILPSVILIILLITNFFSNLKNIYNNSFEARINNVYGFCSNESTGYLKYLKKKYELDNNPKIINYVQAPNVKWAIIDPGKIKLKSNEIILLNYPGKEIFLNHTRESNNFFYINDLGFYKNQINKIDKVILSFNSNVNLNNISLELYSEIRNGKRNFLKTFDHFYKISKSEYQINVDLNFNKIYPKNNNIGFKINNLKDYKIQKIKILAKNKLDMSNYELLDNYKKCFLIKKK